MRNSKNTMAPSRIRDRQAIRGRFGKTHVSHGVTSLGFTLIETMVALVVLSVGMIGIAAMFGEGLTAGRTAALRSQAVNLVADMADRIRSNRTAAAAYAGSAANNQCDPQTGGGVDCTPPQMAAHDLYSWDKAITARLPEGAGTVIYDATSTPPTYTITVSWTQVGQGASGGTLSYATAIQLPEF